MILKGGTLVIDRELVRKDLVIEDGKISEIADDASGDDVIDVSGLTILPGLIDAHVHFRDPGETEKEDFESGSRAAAAGGVTTVLDMPNNKPAITTTKLLEHKREIAKKSIVDFGLHFGATEENSDELKSAENICAVKVVMGATTGSLLVESDDALDAVCSSGKRIIIHAEDSSCLKEHESEQRASKTVEHNKVRPPKCAEIALERAIAIAKKHKTRLHVAHTTTARELEMIADAKREMPISCEVTPHHLFLSEKDAMRLGNFGKMNPPLRAEEDVEALWRGIGDGTVDIIATDHAPHLRSEKEQPYSNAPSGVPGVQTMLPLLLDAVSKDRLTLGRLAELTSENPARIFGLSGKGGIKVGNDADLAIVDLDKEKTIKNEDMASRCGWTPFDGARVKGALVRTIVRGAVVYDNGTIKPNQGREVSVEQ